MKLYNLYISSLLGRHIFKSKLARKDPKSAAKILQICSAVYEKATMSAYMREMGYLIKYAISVDSLFDIWPITVDMMQFFLTHRLKHDSFSCFQSAWAGVIFTHRAAGKDCTYLYTNDTLSKYRKDVLKAYGTSEDIRDPILLEHYIEYAKYYAVSRKTATSVPILSLFKVMIAQLCGAVGTRAMIFFPYKKTITFINKLRSLPGKGPFFIPNNKKSDSQKRKDIQGVFGQDVIFHDYFMEGNGTHNNDLKYYKFVVYSYKNKKCKLDKKDVYLGYTYHEHFDPAYFLRIYLQRIKLSQPRKYLLAKNSKNYSNEFFFRWPTNEPVITTHLTKIFNEIKRVTSIPNDAKITPYSARIGLATMMLQRGLSESDIYDFGAWARPRSASAMHGYIRLPERRKVLMAAFIAHTNIKFDSVLFSPQDFHH